MRQQREDLLNFLKEVIGEEGCGASCEDAEIFEDGMGWKLMLGGYSLIFEPRNIEVKPSTFCGFLLDIPCSTHSL